MRAPSRILGQECAEMLGMVSMQKDFLKRIAKKDKKPMKPNQPYTVRSLDLGSSVLADRYPSHI